MRPPSTPSRFLPAAVALLASLAGCLGDIGGEDAQSSSKPPNQPESCDAPATLAPAPVRRLSHAEYLATIHDLFPSVKLENITVGRDPNDHGFENRAALLNPQPMLIEEYSTAAAEVAIELIADPASIIPCDPAKDAAACATQFVDAFGQRVFRRPLGADEKTTYAGFLNGEIMAGSDFNGAVQLTMEAMLQAPQFLYRLEFGTPDPAAPDQAHLSGYEVATRMSYLLWGSTPDATLLQKAAADQLETAEAREAEARRMLADPRAAAQMVEFHRQWLDFDRLEKEPKDAATYPDYTPDLEAAIREESNRFVADVMWKGDGTLRSFLTSTKTEVNAPLAKLYGVTPPANGWAEVDLDPSQRAGFLTRANFLASRAHKVGGSPPLRAIFIYQRLLCLAPPSPPANADLSEPGQKPGSMMKETNRQLFEDRLSPQQCAGCHKTFTPLGYAFESYDAVGAYRTMDNGQPVDATGEFQSGDIDWKLTSGIDVSKKLADSPEVQSCAASTWFEYAAGRAKDDGDACRVKALEDTLSTAKGDVREMLVALVKNPEFVRRPVVKP